MKNKINYNLRYNLLTTLVYIIGSILLIQLFRLQIVKGEEYRETSNARLTRESSIEAARGEIRDRTGKVLATTRTGYSVELYKIKNNNNLNETILGIVNLLEKNDDKYINNFPINSNLEFTYDNEEKIKSWKKKNNIPQDATPKECIEKFKQKYNIKQEDINDVLKIIAIRYEITTNGYSTTKSIKIAKDISKESAIQFNEQNANFPGVNIIEEPIRVYTSGKLASHVLGYIGKINSEELKTKADQGYKMTDYIGRTGIEYVLENYLKGTRGNKQIDMSVDGTVVEEYIVEEAISGKNVTLTIDAGLQERVEDIIEDSVNYLRRRGKNCSFGAAVLMNVKSGEVLAICSYPYYTPESFIGGISTEEWRNIQDGDKLFNRAVQGAYAPGSTFKMVTATAALEDKVVTEGENIYDRGVYPYGHNPVCWYYTQYHTGHGNVNLKSAIQKSCNYYFYEMGRRLGIDELEKYARYYGLGQKTGIELNGETAGTVASVAEAQRRGEGWYSSYTLSAAIGQLYNSYSPVQMARYISMVSNGGNFVTPTLIKEVDDGNGNKLSKQEVRNKVNETLGISTDPVTDIKASNKTLNAVRAGMRMVTSQGGTAYTIFKGFNKSIAGKTGSAQAGDVTNGWFVGFTPYDNTEVAIAVILEDGAVDSYAAQAAKKIIEAYYDTEIEEMEELKEDMSALIYTER